MNTVIRLRKTKLILIILILSYLEDDGFDKDSKASKIYHKRQLVGNVCL